MIKIRKVYTMPPNDVQKIAHQMAVKMKGDYDIDAKWESATLLKFTGSGAANGVNGKVEIHTNPKEIIVEVTLPFMLVGLQSVIEKEIKDTLMSNVH